MTARRQIRMTMVAAACALAASSVTLSHAQPPGHAGAKRGAVATADDVRISPGIDRVGAVRAKPPTLSFCKTHYGIACYGARQIQRAYHLPPLYRRGVTGAGQTIVIVDPFGSPTIAHDLRVFDHTYGLPAPSSLAVIQPAGTFQWHANATDEGWAGETTLDVEYAHTIAPRANILLVETPVSEEEGTTGFAQIIKAETYVINHHLGGVISQSFSATEQTFPTAQALLALRSAYRDAAAKGVTVLAASGDSGAADVANNETDYYLHPVTSWPDSDPLVTGIGATELHLNGRGKHITRDTAWNDTYDATTQKYIFGVKGPNPLATGGGKSIIFARPRYQNAVAPTVGQHRGVPDISMSGACNGAVVVYQSFAGQPAGWYPTCGTSEATPEFAGIVALADQVAGHGLGLINPTLYRMSARHATGLVDVTSGNNTVSFPQAGSTHTVKGFPAKAGYDLSTGVGTVDARLFVPQLARG